MSPNGRPPPHGESCPCLPCADLRKFLGRPIKLRPLRPTRRAS
jgi:hypothetical protein